MSATAFKPYTPFEVRLDWIASARVLNVVFSEDITNNKEKKYTRDTVHKITDKFIRMVLLDIFEDRHVRRITVKRQGLVIHHNGSRQASLEARVLMALRSAGKTVVEVR